MEKREFTPVQAMEVLNWKKNKMYYWISTKKFETIERETGTNILLTDEQIKRLRVETVSESLKDFENSSESSEEVLKNSNPNVTKHYETFSNNSEQFKEKFYLQSLETIKTMHQASLQNFNFSMKLLTDGKNDLEEHCFKLEADNKTFSESLKQKEAELKQFETELTKKNYVIISLITSILFLCALCIWEHFKPSQTVQSLENIKQIEQFQTFPDFLREKSRTF